MSKREQYGLLFNKIKLSNGEIAVVITEKTSGGDNSVLTFMRGLSRPECESFINDLNNGINDHGNVDEGFFSDSVEHMSILYQYPNINIDDVLIIPMQEMKSLLEEWLLFIS